jgi:hypothetical protein
MSGVLQWTLGTGHPLLGKSQDAPRFSVALGGMATLEQLLGSHASRRRNCERHRPLPLILSESGNVGRAELSMLRTSVEIEKHSD